MGEIAIILTGGTFDKDYDPLRGTLAFRDTHFARIARNCRIQNAICIEKLFLKDSLDFSDADRQLLRTTVENNSAKRIVVIHGTDTMVESAKALTITDKTVVFTGAMRPWALGKSDAEFNLGMALGIVQTLSYGCYITMGGMYWCADEVEKHYACGLFRGI